MKYFKTKPVASGQIITVNSHGWVWVGCQQEGGGSAPEPLVGLVQSRSIASSMASHSAQPGQSSPQPFSFNKFPQKCPLVPENLS